jgi:hypothetical protein
MTRVGGRQAVMLEAVDKLTADPEKTNCQD